MTNKPVGGIVAHHLTVRDFFIGQALAGIMANPERWKQIAKDYKSGKKTYDECSIANVKKAINLANHAIKMRSE